jgi:hypothetical protein
VFTANGLPCGFGKVIRSGVFGFLPVYADDVTTPEIDGARLGEDLLLTVNGKTATINGSDGSGASKLRWLGQHAVAKVELTVTSNPRPTTVAVGQNHPNPFNPETWIPYQLSSPAEVTIRIYNVKGQLIYSLNLGHQPAGFYLSKDKAIHWDGKDSLGDTVASGMYFYTLQAGEFRATRKMVIMK